MVPPVYSGDVYVKASLAVLLLGVDIPVSAVATLGTVTGIFPAVAYAWDWIGSLGFVNVSPPFRRGKCQ